MVAVSLAPSQTREEASARNPRGKYQFLKQLAEKIEPGLKGQPERVRQYVHFFRNEIGNDFRLFAFDVSPLARGDRHVQLRGHIEFPETRASLVKFLEILGFTVDDQLQSLPAADLGGQIFGFVKTSHSLSYDKPRGKRTVETDSLLAEPLYLLREQEGHFLVHTGEGYLAYVEATDVVRVDASRFTQYLNGPSVRIVADHVVNERLVVPLGARLKWVNTTGSNVTIELPTGELVALPDQVCEMHHDPDETLDTIIHNAKQFLDTPYLWGGRTKQGVDCSGLVQIAFSIAGLHIPRDSYQQFYVGKLTATRWHTAGLRRGDTLYFLGDDGKIRHTGIYLGEDRFLHAVSPRVRVNSFNPQHEDYDPHRHASFAFAKRLLD